MPYQKGKLNSRAALNYIKLEALPYFVFSGNADIVPYGRDNLYPFRVIEAVKKSPTASGCIKRQSEFIFGNGCISGGDIVVNRDGETLNDIIQQAVNHGYSQFNGFAIHCNFNSLGQICEMYHVNLEYLRKWRSLDKVEYGIWRERNTYFTDFYNITVDLYNRKNIFKKMREVGTRNYKGQVYYYSHDRDIYPTAPLDAAIMAASYEKESQIYPYANIKNGFSGNTVIKMPSLLMGEDADEEVQTLQGNFEKMHGAEHAGSSIVIPVPTTKDGEPKEFKMVEHLSPTNVDNLFVNQNKKAENDILKVFNMPGILLGIPSGSAFNKDEIYDAWEVKNADVEIDRQNVEREFNKLLKDSVWNFDLPNGIQLQPRTLKPQKDDAGQVDI